MEKITSKWILLAAATLFAFASCDDDRNSNPTLRTPATFVLNTPAYASGNVCDLETSTGVELTCSPPDYGFAAATVYTVRVSLDGDFDTEGKSLTLPTTFSKAKLTVDATELAVAQTTLALSAGRTEADFPITTPLTIRLRAALTNGMGETSSNPVTIERVRTVFALSPVVLPAAMYVAGSGIGNWDWNSALAMVPTWDNLGTFWHIIYCAAGDEMKFNTVHAPDGSEFGTAATLVDNAEAGAGPGSDGSLRVTNAGWYLVVLRTAIEGRTLRYTVIFEQPYVYLIGATARDGAWAIDAANRFAIPATRDGRFVSPPFESAGEVRMCVSIEGEDWWHSEFILSDDGHITYRGTGGDQERYTQAAGRRAHLDFMTGNGSYE
ncbi:MAG: SusF/SusE family outer membrane protein [Tannerella sp.]|jgi:hypothetical protein|nr:SusF/SusE family outer membrane protein [Tannerella sp.]